jgi:hypothetical protein
MYIGGHAYELKAIHKQKRKRTPSDGKHLTGHGNEVVQVACYF